MALRINPRLAQYAGAMRRDPTPAEQRLWNELRGSRLAGLKFRRQSVLHGRIADFYCPSACLIVEVDGDTHDHEDDRACDEQFRYLGLRTLRVTNSEVLHNLAGVLDAIVAAAKPTTGITHPPAPSLKREGEKC